MIIEHNTILYTGGITIGKFGPLPLWDNGYAIKIRGNPADKAVVDGNAFKHEDLSDAIAQNGNPGVGDNITNTNDVRPNNIFGADPLPNSGVVISSATGTRISSWPPASLGGHCRLPRINGAI
jgi:hypothetical protein